MMGLICYRDAGEKNGTRMLCGVNFCAVYVTRGEGVLAQLSAKRAVKYLKKRRVRQAVFPKGYPNAPVFARLGILPPAASGSCGANRRTLCPCRRGCGSTDTYRKVRYNQDAAL